MEETVGCAIEKIKLQELNTNAKLKEKRELELSIATLNKNIRDTLAFIEKSKQNQNELAKKNYKLLSQLEITKIRRDALLHEIEVCEKELTELIKKTDEDISNVWTLRSSMLSTIHEVTDNYDIFALLTKPSLAPTGDKLPVEVDCDIENELKEAMQRKNIALAERERLLNEPETGAEFIRIQNALKHSLAKIARGRDDKNILNKHFKNLWFFLLCMFVFLNQD